MTMDQFLTDILEKKSRKLLSHKEEKLLILDTLEKLTMMTELFRGEIRDVVIPMSERESLEWDAHLKRFIYHKDETSRYLELARKEVLFRVRPYLQDLLKKAGETLKG
jgi:hypothetical protein